MKEDDNMNSNHENKQSKEVCSHEKKEIMTKQNIRFLFFSICSLVTYTLFVRKLFREKEFLVSWILFCILFIELIFLSIDVRGVKKRIMRWWLFILGIVLCCLVPNPVWQVITAIWLSLITIGYLLIFLRWYFKNVRKIDWLVYFTRWGYIFTLLTSITFWFAILWINTKFPFQCDQISHINDNLLKSTTSWWFSNKSDNAEKKSMIQLDLGNDVQELEEDENTTIIRDARNVVKESMVDWFIQTKDVINNKVCEAIVSEIDQIYQNPVFQVGAVFWIYLLFYWVIRIFVWVVTIIWYVIFTIARILWLYKVEKVEAMVEDVL